MFFADLNFIFSIKWTKSFSKNFISRLESELVIVFVCFNGREEVGFPSHPSSVCSMIFHRYSSQDDTGTFYNEKTDEISSCFSGSKPECTTGDQVQNIKQTGSCLHVTQRVLDDHSSSTKPVS